MTNKEKFMEYAKQRLREKEYRRRKFLLDLADVQAKGVERCSRGTYKIGQRRGNALEEYKCCEKCNKNITELHHVVFRSQAPYMANIKINFKYLCPEDHRWNKVLT